MSNYKSYIVFALLLFIGVGVSAQTFTPPWWLNVPRADSADGQRHTEYFDKLKGHLRIIEQKENNKKFSQELSNINTRFDFLKFWLDKREELLSKEEPVVEYVVSVEVKIQTELDHISNQLREASAGLPHNDYLKQVLYSLKMFEYGFKNESRGAPDPLGVMKKIEEDQAPDRDALEKYLTAVGETLNKALGNWYQKQPFRPILFKDQTAEDILAAMKIINRLKNIVVPKVDLRRGLVDDAANHPSFFPRIYEDLIELLERLDVDGVETSGLYARLGEDPAVKEAAEMARALLFYMPTLYSDLPEWSYLGHPSLITQLLEKIAELDQQTQANEEAAKKIKTIVDNSKKEKDKVQSQNEKLGTEGRALDAEIELLKAQLKESLEKKP